MSNILKEVYHLSSVVENFDTKKIKKKLIKKKIYFIRNEYVEGFSEKINHYSSVSGLKFKFKYSSYSNDLEIPSDNWDIIIIWLDYSVFKINNFFFTWIKKKLEILSDFATHIILKPIILENQSFSCLKKLNIRFQKYITKKNIIFPDYLDILKDDQKKYWDVSRSKFFGTKVSQHGQDLNAKILGLKILPSLYQQKIKAIIFDLDDTLYKGAIGEGGLKNIFFDKFHKKAKKIYKKLFISGTILSICSKNNTQDTNLLFKKKILEKKIFFPIFCNWERKSKNILNIQKIIKVSFENILFIDNNINEILEVKKKIKNINVYWIKNSESLYNCLKFFPNINEYFKSSSYSINKKRILDIKASLKRDSFKKKNSIDSRYIKELRVELSFKQNNLKEFNRIFSLTNKVNQFIFNYKRFNKSELLKYFSKNKMIFTISLRDKFSDSGNIGVVYLSINNNNLILDEVCISCRALGRNIENIIIFYPIIYIIKKFNIKNLLINIINGKNNFPAIKYFNDLKKKIKKNNNLGRISTRSKSISISNINQKYLKDFFLSGIKDYKIIF
jgi:FkbH-like protein